MRTIAIVPTYQNAGTLPRVLADLEAQGFPVLAVDDGSTDGTGALLHAWAAAAPERHVEAIGTNAGKGRALKRGLARARALGFARAVTVDADGQHLAADARRVADAHADGLTVGARAEQVDGYPARSLFGRRLWAMGVRALTGLGVPDPICGLRAYPLDGPAAAIRCRAGRFAWEEEWLVRAAWAGIPVRWESITTIYLPPGQRVSHWAWHDWLRNVGAWMLLAAERLLPWTGPWQPDALQPLAVPDRSTQWLAWTAFVVAAAIGAAGGAFGPNGLMAVVTLVVLLAVRWHVKPWFAARAALIGWLVVAAGMLIRARGA